MASVIPPILHPHVCLVRHSVNILPVEFSRTVATFTPEYSVELSCVVNRRRCRRIRRGKFAVLKVWSKHNSSHPCDDTHSPDGTTDAHPRVHGWRSEHE